MSNWAGGILTAAGRELQAKIEAGATPLIITKMKLGDGSETIDEVDDLIDLVQPKVDMRVSSATYEGQTATITGIITTTQVTIGFYAREWGLFAQDPVAGEILYMVTVDDMPEWIPPSTSAAQISATYAMNVAVANATTIIANIDLAGLVDVDMLLQHTHTVRRQNEYEVADILNAPTLQDGLLLECQSEGTTAETLVDYSKIQWGDEFLDGSVMWNAKRIMLAPNSLYCYNPEWMAMAIQRLIQFALSVQRNAYQAFDIDGTIRWFGGSGRDVDVEHIGSFAGGTFFLQLSYTEPQSMEYAWLETQEDIGTTYNARPIFEMENGDTIGATKIQIVREDGAIFYIDTISRDPSHSGGGGECPCYELATDAEVERMLNESLPL